MRIGLIILLLISFLGFSLETKGQKSKREFRGVWIATVNNLDWPSDPLSDNKTKEKELTDILDRLEELNFNAVIFQIRPLADALYISSTEPCSKFLTGTQGKCPEDGWDPLSLIINECHKRGMELHAWINPFRVLNNLKENLSDKNIALKHPEWTVTYDSKLYLDPGIPEVRTYLNQIVKEVVERYNVDAIHFDDYFYPYPVNKISFPDTSSFKLYNRGYQITEIDNWRRENVDLIIQSLSTEIKRIKPDVKFGISPFGVWQNYTDHYTGSVTNAGITNFNHLYADVTRWLCNGWIDYVIPQIYWEIGHPKADFVTLSNWWNENSCGRHVYIGHALYKLADDKSPAWDNENEMPEQVSITRKLKDVYGNAFFRMKYLDKNPKNFTNILKKDIYNKKALVPQMAWIDSIAPNSPAKLVPRGFFSIKKIVVKYAKKQQPSDDILGYVIYKSDKKNEVNIDNPDNIVRFTDSNEIKIEDLNLPAKKRLYIWVTAIDKHQNESLPVGNIKIKKKK